MIEACTPQGEQIMLLTKAEYDSLIEDAGDVALASAAPRARALPAELARQVLDGAMHPLTAWRKAAGMAMNALAAKTGQRVATISDIENGKIDPRYGTVKALALALGLDPDDIMP